MPLRFGSDDAQPAEPIPAVRPPAADFEDRERIRTSYTSEPAPEKGNLILKIVIGAIFAYAAAMAVGLCALMFPHESHEIVRAVHEGMALVRPDPPKPRVMVVQSIPAATNAPAKTAVTAPRKRYRKVESPNFGTVEVVDSNHRHSDTPTPPTPSVTVSVDGSKPAGQPAN